MVGRERWGAVMISRRYAAGGWVMPMGTRVPSLPLDGSLRVPREVHVGGATLGNTDQPRVRRLSLSQAREVLRTKTGFDAYNLCLITVVVDFLIIVSINSKQRTQRG